MSHELPIQERLLVGALKKLRDRSLTNPNWVRDPDLVLAHVTNTAAPTSAANEWPIGSVLEMNLADVATATRSYRRQARSHPGSRRAGGDEQADALWLAVLAAIDELLAKADRLNGSRIRPHK